MTIDELIELCEQKRLKKKLTKKELAEISGISEQFLGEFLNGKKISMNTVKLLKLFDTLGVQIK